MTIASILGTFKIAVLYAAPHRALTSTEPISKLLKRALSEKGAIAGCYRPSTPKPTVNTLIPVELQSQDVGEIVEHDGKYYLIGSEVMEYLPDMPRIKAYQDLWDITKETLKNNIEGDDVALARSQHQLNEIYDAFVLNYGDPQDKSNKSLFRSQQGYGIICSLLINGEKSAIFHRRTVAKSEEFVVTDAESGYFASLNQFGRVEPKWIAKKLGVSLEQAIAQLQSFAYYDGDFPPQDPADANADDWLDRNEYISGNVRKRLEKAQMWFTQELPAWLDVEFYLDILRHNQPLPCVPPHFEIKRQVIERLELENYLSEDQIRDMFTNHMTLLMGAPFGKHTSAIYEAFARFLFHDQYDDYEDQVQAYLRTGESMRYEVRSYWRSITVTLDKAKHEFEVELPGWVSNMGKNKTEWSGGAWRTGLEIFEICLGDKSPIVYDTIYFYEDGVKKSRRIENKEGTAASSAAKKKMLKAWEDWLWGDLDRAVMITNWYNSEINCYKNPVLDGSYLKFPDAAETFNGKPLVFQQHQLNLVELAIRNHGIGTGAFHCVGAGKTLEAAMIAMKLRKLVNQHKTLIVVLGSTITQFADQCRAAFPQATLLVRSPDTNADLRREFLARLAFESYDIAICTKEDFAAIPYSSAMEASYTKADLSSVEKSKSAKLDHKKKQQKMQMLQARLNYLKSGKDDSLYWVDLGIDCVIFDESQALLNLPVKSSLRNVSGIPTGEGSKQASDALIKFQDLYSRNKRVILMTGTHLVNTIAQMYSNQQLLQPQILQDMGIDHFDAWRGTFGKVVTSLEITATGRMKVKERFSDFNNVPELKSMCLQSMDIMPREALNLPAPKINHIVLSSPPHASQIAYMDSLVRRALAVKEKKVDPKDDNMLVITTDGILSCMHMALVDPTSKDWVNHKLNACAWNVWKIWKATRKVKATQIVFSDLSTPKKQERPYKVVQTPSASTRMVVAKGGKGVDDRQLGYLFQDADTKYWSTRSIDGKYVSEPFTTQNDACLDLMWELNAIPENYGVAEFTAYQYIKQVCVALGMPEDQFQFIHDHENAKRDILFDQINAGDVAVVMGSSPMLGTGVNIQQRLIAIHKIDVPWTPSKDEQRTGRIERPGNMFEKYGAYSFQYLTQGSGGVASIDGFKAQALQAKADGFRDFNNPNSKKRKCGDIDAEPMTYAQMKAISSGDPRLMDKFKYESELLLLQSEERAWQMNQKVLRGESIRLPRVRTQLIDTIALVTEAIAHVEPYLVKPEPPVLAIPENAEPTDKKAKKVKKVKPPTLPIDQIIDLDGIVLEGDAREDYLIETMKQYTEHSRRNGAVTEAHRKVGTYCGCDLFMGKPEQTRANEYHSTGYLLFPNGYTAHIKNVCYFRSIKSTFTQCPDELRDKQRELVSVESKIVSTAKELERPFVDENGNSIRDRIDFLKKTIDELEVIFQQEVSEQQFAIRDSDEFYFEDKSRPALMPDEANPKIIKHLLEKEYTFWFREEDDYPNWLADIAKTVEAMTEPQSNVIAFPDIKKDYGFAQQKSDLLLTSVK